MFGLKEEIRARRRRNNFMQWERPLLENGQVAGGDRDQVAVSLCVCALQFLTGPAFPHHGCPLHSLFQKAIIIRLLF